MINENRKETGNRIKKLREEKGYRTIQSFAEKLGYSRQTVAKWENGDTMPNLDTLYDIVSILDCDIGYLLCLYDTKYFEHAEICKETGLSEKAAEILRDKMIILTISNAVKDAFNIPPVSNSTFTSFTNFLIENGEKVYTALEDFILHQEDIARFEREDEYPLIRAAFDEIDERTSDIALLERENKDEFYRLLEIKMRDKDAKTTLENIKKLENITKQNETITSNAKRVPPPPKAVTLIKEIAKDDTISDKLEMFKELGLYELLKMEKNARYFKYEISDAFMDIVKEFLEKVSEENG